MRLAWMCALLVVGCGSRSRLLSVDGIPDGAGGVGAIGGVGGTSVGGASGCGPVDVGAPCAALGEVACLLAFPRCAPVYDDQCCPLCAQSPSCADCVSWRFHECIDRELSNCEPGTVGHCGVTPDWACQGARPDCSGTASCGLVPGCVAASPAGCAPDGFCPPECHPVSAGMCGPVCGPGLPPPCPSGTVPEVSDGHTTGYCIDASACASGAPTCPAQMPHGPCSSPGLSCTYGQCSSCTCQDGFWSCVTPPC